MSKSVKDVDLAPSLNIPGQSNITGANFKLVCDGAATVVATDVYLSRIVSNGHLAVCDLPALSRKDVFIECTPSQADLLSDVCEFNDLDQAFCTLAIWLYINSGVEPLIEFALRAIYTNEHEYREVTNS